MTKGATMKRPVVIAVVGGKSSGKTTTIEANKGADEKGLQNRSCKACSRTRLHD
jgi:hypothetical protein